MLNRSMAGRVLLIGGRDKRVLEKISSILNKNELLLAVEHDLGTAINRAQNARFDVIVLDANIKGIPIEQAIHILRDIDPGVKIIVKTRENSKELEAKVRQEKIYYYHLESFGTEDLKLAIISALGRRRNFFLSGDQTSAGENLKKILMVDQNDEFIEVHRANLENHNFDVQLSFNADEAFNVLKKDHPHVVMVDLDIQVGSDGLHFLEKMMMDEEARQTPVLLFYSRTRMDLHGMLLEKAKAMLPTCSYLEKPIKIEDVVPTVNALLATMDQKNTKRQAHFLDH